MNYGICTACKKNLTPLAGRGFCWWCIQKDRDRKRAKKPAAEAGA